ncbi:MAG: hypothetical protein K8S97_11075 [Anaerolineae bacterium]|nr:hypothetical protein [Anaerolineae bacterium]
MSQAKKAELYTRYPWSSVLMYHGVTVLHFGLAGFGLHLGFGESGLSSALTIIYLLFAFGQMYVIMPLNVCPNCPYYRMEGDARCISALNLLSRRIAVPGKPQRFKNRAKGILCHNNLYMAALIAPIPLLIIGLILNFSAWLLAITAAVVGLLLFRFFVLFKQVACVHCHAKQRCPNAAQMGLNK